MLSPPMGSPGGGIEGDANEPLKVGSLEKMKNKNFLGIEVWSSRWVVLRRSGLEYFATNRPGEAVRGRIATKDLKGVDVNTKKRPWGFTVSLRVKLSVNHVLRAAIHASRQCCHSDPRRVRTEPTKPQWLQWRRVRVSLPDLRGAVPLDGKQVYATNGTAFEFAAETKEIRDDWVGGIYWLHRDQLVANVRSALPSQAPVRNEAAYSLEAVPSLPVATRDPAGSFQSAHSLEGVSPTAGVSLDYHQAFSESDFMTVTPVQDHPIHLRPDELRAYAERQAGTSPKTPSSGLSRPMAASMMGGGGPDPKQLPPVTPGREEMLFGKKVGKDDFDYLRVVGEGAHAKVMQVREKASGRHLAMKVLNKKRVIDMGQVDNIMIERRVLEQINHPFFVNLHYAFQTKDKLYLVLDFCNGGELFYHMKNEVRFSLSRASLYSAEIALGLEHMHSIGVIYRDLKPENLLIDAEGHIRFADFGMCKRALMGNMEGGRERAISVCGTPEYMAPEVIQGNGKQEYSKGVDWWALGTLLYEMLAGRPPFYNGDRSVMFQRILHSPIPANQYVPPAAFDLASRFLDRNPRTRLGSGSRDFDNIRAHPFFAPLDWEAVTNRKTVPEFVPSAQADYVDPCFSSEPVRPHGRKSQVSPSWDETNFKGFSYNPHATADLTAGPAASGAVPPPQ